MATTKKGSGSSRKTTGRKAGSAKATKSPKTTKSAKTTKSSKAPKISRKAPATSTELAPIPSFYIGAKGTKGGKKR